MSDTKADLERQYRDLIDRWHGQFEGECDCPRCGATETVLDGLRRAAKATYDCAVEFGVVFDEMQDQLRTALERAGVQFPAMLLPDPRTREQKLEVALQRVLEGTDDMASALRTLANHVIAEYRFVASVLAEAAGGDGK